LSTETIRSDGCTICNSRPATLTLARKGRSYRTPELASTEGTALNNDRALSSYVNILLLFLRNVINTFLPSTDLEAGLVEVCSHHGPMRELPTRQRLQGLLRSLGIYIFDVNLTNTVRLSASARWSRYLHLKYLAIFLALFHNVFIDF